MFEFPFGIFINIFLTPEPRNCGLPGPGVRGSGVRDSVNVGSLTKFDFQKFAFQNIDFQKHWFPKTLIYTFVDAHISTPDTRAPDPRTPGPGSPQFRGSGVRKICMNMPKGNSNICEKCLSSQILSRVPSAEFRVPGTRASGLGGRGSVK
jgi:hypothetical protein